MSENAIFLPCFAMVLLSAFVWFAMYRERFGQIRSKRIHPQSLSQSADLGRLEITKAADNFRNLFELPVLFYLAAVIAYITDTTDWLLLALSWSFVLLRFVHSYIHVTYNKVRHRFYIYAAGGFVLWTLWAVLLVKLLIQ